MIRVYLDTKFISSLKENLTTTGRFSRDFDNYKSLYKFLSTNKKGEIFLAEKKTKISIDEFQSMITREGSIPFEGIEISDYSVNGSYDFDKDNRLTILLFIDLPTDQLNAIETSKGIFASNSSLCSKRWKSISLNSIYAKTISISFRDYQNNSFSFGKVLANYNYNCNSLLLVDRYLRFWSNRTILANLIPLIESTVPNTSCKGLSITIITSEKTGNSYTRSVDDLYELINDELEDIYDNLDFSFIVVMEDRFSGGEKSQVQNIIHDRHLMTNYVHLSSLHSFDINGESGVKKDTELNVKSILESSHYSNMLRKRKSYFELLKKINEAPNSFIVYGDYENNLHFKDL